MSDYPPRIFPVLAAALVLSALAACGGDTTSPPSSGATVKSVDVEAPSTSALPGDTVRMTSTPLDSAFEPVSGEPAAVWSSETPSVATVSSSGLVTAVAPGGTRIFATIDGIRGERSFTVFSPVTSIALTGPSRPIVPTATFAAGHTLGTALGPVSSTEGRAVRWSSSDAGVATVDPDGLVTAVGPGTATISLTAVREQVSGSVDISVTTLTYRTVQYTGGWATSHFACALTTAGHPWCWGQNVPGQLYAAGVPPFYTAIPVPTMLDTDLTFDSMSVGADHICALDAAGHAYCWGGNGDGQLGDGTVTARWTPALVSGGHNFASIEAGETRTCALTVTGSAWCWGRNDRGQFGDGSTTSSMVPVPAVTGIPLATITLSHGMTSVGGPSCGLGLNGVAYCWGANDYGQAGTGTRSPNPIAPTPVASPTALVSVVAGGEHTCGLTADGTAMCWGSGGESVLGYPVSYPGIDSIPGMVQGAPKFTKLRAGLGDSCGLTAAGAAYCWGTPYGSSPRTVTAPAPLKELQVEVDNLCGIGNDQVAYCWSGMGSVHKELGQL